MFIMHLIIISQILLEGGKMEKLLKGFMVLFLSFSVVACAQNNNAQTLKDGKYSNTQQGFGGDVTLNVTIESGKITSAEIIGDNETESIGQAAFSKLIDNILKAQSEEFDLVSGATVTSTAVKQALSEIINEAKGNEKEVKSAQLTDGVFTAEAWSFGTTGKLVVDVTVKNNQIENIVVTDSTDTDIILNTAIENLIPSIIEHQSVKVDSTTGATISSNAIKTAVEDALIQSLADDSQIAAFYKTVAKSEETEVIDTDILVVGLGGAGITTATRAIEELNKNGITDVKVLGIDKSAKYGGTSVTTSSPMSINPSTFVKANNNEEYVDADELKKAWMDYTEGDAKEWAIDIMMDESGNSVDWLIEKGFVFGEPMQGLSDPYKICVAYGGQFGTPKSVVQTYFDKIMDTFVNYGGEYMLQVEATDLIKEGNKIVGVKAVGADGTQYTINAKYVVLSTGGFAGNGEMTDKYFSDEYYDLAGGGQYNVYGMLQNDGKMIQAAIDNGASTYNIGMPPVSHIGGAYKIMHEFPVIELDTVDFWTGRKATNSLNDIPMMMAVAPNSLAVNREGVRFSDETTLAAYGNWQAGAYYYTIWSEAQIKDIEENGLKFDTIGIFVNQGGWPSNKPIPEIYEILNAGIEMGYIYKADTLEELAEKINVDADTLVNTVKDYNEYCDTRTNPKDGIIKSEVIYDLSGNPVEGDYETFEKVEGDGAYYAVKGSPWIYSTVGALNVNEQFQVLDTNNMPIEGLYAAGTDCLGVLFTEKKEYVTYGGADQGWAFTSGYLLGKKLAEEFVNEQK